MSLQQQLKAFTTFHQRWEVEPGVFTPGGNDIARLFRLAHVPDDLSGRRVLDIGAFNGCCSFECERRGAAEVVAMDLQDPTASGFNFLKDHLKSRVTYRQGSVYNLDGAEMGTFDLVLFFGVLYHLRYPLLGLDRIRGICRADGQVLMETHVLTEPLMFREGGAEADSRTAFAAAADTRTPIWRFYRAFECHPNDPSNWFGPNIPAVLEGTDSAGFRTELLETWEDRASFHAVPDEDARDRIYRTQEGLSPINRRFVGLDRPVRRNPLFG